MSRQRRQSVRPRRITLEALESRQLLTAWRNPVDAIDVNHDGQIGAFDAIEIINELNSRGIQTLPAIKPAAAPFLDPTGDGDLTAFDALAVINHLNTRPAGVYVLQEQAGRFADQQNITIAAGDLPAGTRTFRLLVLPQFDQSDSQSGSEDIFTASLFDPLTGQTVIDAGLPGSALFTLRGTEGTAHNGLVQWNGTHLTIDLSHVTAETLELRLQLLNPDADTGTQVAFSPVSNEVDPLGVPGTPGTLRSEPAAPAGVAANANTYLQMPTLRVELENPIYNAATGRFTAEVRLSNETAAPITNAIVRLPGVAAAKVVNASGTVGNVPYWNFASVIGAGGLASGAKTEWIKIELDLGGQSMLWRPDARGYTSSEVLAQLGVFSTTYSAPQERQIFHMQLNAGEQLLTLPMRSPSSEGASIRWLQPNGEQDYSYPDSYYDRFDPFYIEQTGDHQFEMIAKSAGEFAVAFQKLGNLPELTIGSELSGYIDPRLAPRVFAFQGTAGQRLVFENRQPVDATQYQNWQVIDQYGTEAEFIAQQIPGGNLEVELRYDGLHYLILRGPGNNNRFIPFDYVLRSPAVVENPLTFGVAESATFSQFNEARAFTFTGVPGQLIVMDQLTKSSGNVNVFLLNPDGEQLPVDVFTAPQPFQADQPFLIDRAGTWKVVLQGSPSDSFSFRVQNLADLDVVEADSDFAGTVQPGRSQYFRVPAVRGERVSLVQNSGGNVLTQMFSPAGGLLPQSGLHQFLINETGEQLLRVYTSDSSTVPFDFTVQSELDEPVAQAGLDVDYSGMLNPGTTSIGTFTASAGTQVMFDRFALAGTAATYAVRISGPGFDRTFSVDSDVLTLPRSGDYTLTAINGGATSVAYGFRIVDLAAAPVLNHGQRIEETFSTTGKTIVYRVAGQAGERLLLGSLDGDLIEQQVIRLKTEAGSGVNYFAHAHVDDFKFVATKIHFLTIEQRYPGATDVRLQAALTFEAQSLPLNTPFSDILGPNGGLQLYKFAAERGDVLKIDALLMSQTVAAGILNSTDSQLDLNEFKRFSIYRNGENYLWLRPWNSSAETLFTLQASFETETAATPIAIGATVTGTLSVGESRSYEFTAAANSLLMFDGLDTFNLARVDIFDDNGFFVFSNIDTRTDKIFNAATGGKFRITVSNSTSPFSFRVSDVRSAPLLPLNTDLQGSMTGGTSLIWRFAASAGQRLYVDSNASASLPFQGQMKLYSPAGWAVATTSATINNDLNVVASSEGDYYLVINADSSFDYELRVRTAETTVVPITLGTTVSGTIRDPGDTVEYVFSGTRGQHVHIEGLTNNAVFRLQYPGASYFGNLDSQSLLLPATGEYRLQVYAGSNTIGATYRLQIADVAMLPLLPLNTPISGSTTQGDWLAYRVPAAVGDRIAFDAQQFVGPAANNSWRLVSPEATNVMFPTPTFVDGDRTLTLVNDGNYVLVVRLPGGAIDYAFQVNTITQPVVTPTGLNQTYSGSASSTNPVIIPFTARAGQRILIDVLDDVALPAARLLGSDGSVVSLNGENDAWATNDRIFVMPSSGAYKLEISAPSSTPRNYRVRLIDADALPLTPQDTPFTINFNLPYQGDVWAFDATVGDQLLFELGEAQLSQSFRLIGPDGKALQVSVGGQPPRVVTMAQSGRHYLVMDGQGITPFTQVAHIWNINNLPLITNQDPITVHFTGRDLHFFSFDLAAGDRVYFTSLSTPPELMKFDFTHPLGYSQSGSISFSNASSPGGFTVNQSGRYTLTLLHPSSTPVDFAFQIHVLPLREIFGAARE